MDLCRKCFHRSYAFFSNGRIIEKCTMFRIDLEGHHAEECNEFEPRAFDSMFTNKLVDWKIKEYITDIEKPYILETEPKDGKVGFRKGKKSVFE